MPVARNTWQPSLILYPASAVRRRRRLLDAIAALGGEMPAAAARIAGCSSANANAISA